MINDNGVVLLRLKFNNPIEFYYYVDGRPQGPKETDALEFYINKEDYEEIKTLVKKISESK